MAIPNTLRYMRVSFTRGYGAIPAVGFNTLIPDPLGFSMPSVSSPCNGCPT